MEACTVPADKELVIEPGAIIVIKCTEPFVVEGRLAAHGTEGHPIYLIPSPEWEGFYFPPNDRDVQELIYVEMPTDPTALRVVVSRDAAIRVEHCELYAMRSCVEITGGYLWADHNYLATLRVYSHTVEIHFLVNDRNGCYDPDGSHLTSNIIKAYADEHGIPSPTEFTTGLYVDGSTNLCLWDNTISVNAPGSTIGAYFGLDAVGGGLSALDSCIVTAKSIDGSPKGVYNANEGTVQVRRCVVDVAEVNPENPYVAAGIIASHQAQVIVNSSSVNLDQDTLWFVGLSGGRLVIDFATRWTNNAGAVAGARSDGLDILDDDDPLTDVTYGSRVYTVNPLLLRHGQWGEWTDSVQIAEYYGIASNSPCIDNGDPTYGNDPDNTLPDIGRFYYPYSPDDIGDLPLSLPAFISLSPAYPNPFNAVTTIPFVLDRASSVLIVAYDVLGRQATILLEGRLEGGKHEVRFDASKLTAGTYLVQMRSNGLAGTPLKVIYLK